MKNFIWKFIKTYLLFIFIFVFQKIIFLFWYHDLYTDVSFADYLKIIGNGLKLDASVAGYLTVIPAIMLVFSLWVNPAIIRILKKGYFAIISFLLSVVFVLDLVLYEYWGFRLDATPFFYMLSPKSALASADWITILLGVVAVCFFCVLFYHLFKKVLINTRKKEKLPYKVLPVAGVLLLLTLLLFIPIRGGFSVAAINTGKVYFSSRLELNHAAINPFFSLLESLNREQDFSEQYRFMPDERAEEIFKTLQEQPVDGSDSIPALFLQERPNIVFVVLESFMSGLMESLGGMQGITPQLDRLCEEGVLFTNFYANSFRTDRGLVSIFSGYPAQPTNSIMKYPRKTQTLPSIPASLKENGYSLKYYYGGDANFTNMRSYLTACGIDDIVSEDDFPLKERTSKWGALDGVLFDRLATDFEGEQQEPFMKIIQTSSSHEPFDVPIHKLKDPYLNSVYYTDSCLGSFIDKYKETKYWDNSIVIFVADHGRKYPANVDNESLERYQIPLLMVGGAVKESQRIATYSSQIDIAATLLSQLNISSDQFLFSKNILNPANLHFAYFTCPDLFGMVTEGNQLVYNCESERVVLNEGEGKNENLEKGKAFLQVLYNDLDAR